MRKYVSQYYPKLRVDIRPQLWKNALQRAVERGQLEQITGKGASGTFQLKKSGEKPLLGGGLMEYANLSAIAAMNEPRTCSNTALKKCVLENRPGISSNYQVHLLKKTLQTCEKNGWMEQISGKGLSGTFQLCFPYDPSPGVLFPKKEPDDSRDEDEDEDESSEDDSEDEEPPPKRRLQKKTPAKSPGKAASVRQRGSKPNLKFQLPRGEKLGPCPRKPLLKPKLLPRKPDPHPQSSRNLAVTPRRSLQPIQEKK
ncbi:Heterochromatin protein 1-binding protein 3 [Sciurus carolinensis]|uniref:Heterochromatin protein 1-binding protein 3 n=1 Tax=Sciurus carolinensis TaxID=30640 RepID=A0AA41N2D7_SCICA|nr:Heterochromatin protein 1-binding protein 3 [Sciurus carolinensis]